jgi:trimeric autotransporter adhesin
MKTSGGWTARALCLAAMVVGALWVLAAARASAQPCGGAWLPGTESYGLNGPVWSSAVMPNGDVVVGGEFTMADGVPARNVARWDGARWWALGAGVNGRVYEVNALADGRVLVGGEFTSAGTVAANRIAQWNGTSWSALGSGVSGLGWIRVYAIEQLPSGDIMVGGGFSNAGSVAASAVAIWSGATWSAMGTGVPFAVRDILVRQSGEVMVGCIGPSQGTQNTDVVYRWDGATWISIATATYSSVYTLLETSTGEIIAGGTFRSISGVTARSIARWNGSTWSAFTPGIPMQSGFDPDEVGGLVELPNGDILVAGRLSAFGGANTIRWDGAAWQQLSLGVYRNVFELDLLPDGRVWACGDILGARNRSGGFQVGRVVIWDSLAWSPVGSAPNSDVLAWTNTPGGDLIAGGRFTNVGGRIARWDGEEWHPLGAGLGSGQADEVRAVAIAPNGDIFAGGVFLQAAGSPASRVARWDGAAWSALGEGLDGTVEAIAIDHAGRVFVGGMFTLAGGLPANCVAMWDGQAWSPLGSGVDAAVEALAIDANGDVIVGGYFSNAGGIPASRVARWDGVSWSPLGSGVEGANAYVLNLTRHADGSLLVGGSFTLAGGQPVTGLARWSGAAWSPVWSDVPGSEVASVSSIVALGGNDFAVSGTFSLQTPGGVATNIATYRDGVWARLGLGLNRGATSLANWRGREVVAGGYFTQVDGRAQGRWARWALSREPWIVRQPSDTSIEIGGRVTLSATIASGYGDVAYRWTRNGVPIANGAGGASPGGGVVAGASGTLDFSARPAVLTIDGVATSDAGEFRVEFTSPCGVALSTAASVVVTPPGSPCDYDFNDDGAINLEDAQQMAQVFVGLLTPESNWLDGDLNGDENSDLTDAQILAVYVVTGNCGV